jgi:multidrug efflux pump subunit AcrB
MGMLSLKSSFFPLNESRMINISLMYPGASPQEMEEGIVLKIEDNLRGLVGIDRFTSVSRENSATITVEVIKGYNVDAVLQDVKNAVDRVPSPPAGMEPPVISKGIFRTEAVSFVISGYNISLKSLKEIAREIESDLRMMEGISQVALSGFPAEEIEIAVDEDKLRAYDLTFREVASAVASTNILVTGGSIKTESEEYLIRVRNRAYYGKELGYVVVKADPSGNKIRLSDVAKIRDRWNENPDRSYYNGKPSIRIAVSTTTSEDLIGVAKVTKDYIEKFNRTHNNVSLDITRDASETVEERSKLLLKNGVQGGLLVLLFLALFLKPRLAFWVAFGLPISFFGMFMFADMLNITINILSLFGMIIVIGILVDDGIVIAENIYHHSEEGKNPIKAAIDGTLEVMTPITSAIATTVLAFSTFFFLEGRVGEFFGEVSLVVILTLTVSLVEALIILPAHVAHSRALTKKQKTYVFNRIADRLISWLRDKLYGPYLKFFLKHKFFGVAIPLMLLIITLGAISGGLIRITFFPSIASDRVSITLRMPQGTNELLTDSLATTIEDAVWAVNEDFKKRQTGNLDIVDNIIKRIGPVEANRFLSH